MPGSSFGGRPSIPVPAPARGAVTSEPVAAEPTPASNSSGRAGRNVAVPADKLIAPNNSGGLSGLWNRFTNWLSGKSTPANSSKSASRKIEEENISTYGAAAYFSTQNTSEPSHAQTEDERRLKEQLSKITR